MNAMTWWDHQTGSVWSQPIGEALSGELKGTRLELLPSQVTTWSNWVTEHPQTFVMTNDLERIDPHLPGLNVSPRRLYPLQSIGPRRLRFNANFVVGVQIGNQALAFYYEDIEQEGIIQTDIGEFPVLAWAADADYRVYLRKASGETLTFIVQGDGVFDEQTNSSWDLSIGLALEGPLQGHLLQRLPSLTSYDWAWLDFYPDSEIYAD